MTKISNYGPPGAAPLNSPGTPGSTSGTLGSVGDGSTTVSPVLAIDFTSGATVTDLGGGVAGVDAAGGTPASTVTDETTWGITPAVGSDTEYARQDHTHGSPAEPAGSGLTVEEVDGSPTVTASKLVLPNGTLGVVGTVATYTPAGGPGGGGLVLIEQHTANNTASTLDFTASIDSTYDEYVIELVNLVPATDGTNIKFIVSTNGGVSWDTGSNYASAAWRMEGGGSGTNSSITTHIPLDQGNGADGVLKTNGGLNGTFHLFNPGGSGYKFVSGQAVFQNHYDSNVMMTVLAGMYKSATAVDALRITTAAGNLQSGTVRVYGVAK